jgi:hypothetical protein
VPKTSPLRRWSRGEVAAVVQAAGVAEGGKGIEKLGDLGAGGAGEGLGELLGGCWAVVGDALAVSRVSSRAGSGWGRPRRTHSSVSKIW